MLWLHCVSQSNSFGHGQKVWPNHWSAEIKACRISSHSLLTEFSNTAPLCTPCLERADQEAKEDPRSNFDYEPSETPKVFCHKRECTPASKPPMSPMAMPPNQPLNPSQSSFASLVTCRKANPSMRVQVRSCRLHCKAVHEPCISQQAIKTERNEEQAATQ